MNGAIVAIYTSAASEAPMVAVAEAVLDANKGLVGDRYFLATGTFSEKLAGKRDTELTLIEAEEVDRFNDGRDAPLRYGDLRRNVVTRGIRLNELVGRRFALGNTMLEGLRLCEPCAHLARIVSPDVLPALVGRAGLRARILSGGTISPGDAIGALPDA
jgi:MOSC domain-containing protein YiiM